MDVYTKCVLTIIACVLNAIAINMTLRPDRALAFLGNGLTFGDWLAAVRDDNPSTVPFEISKRAPLTSSPIFGPPALEKSALFNFLGEDIRRHITE